MKSYTYTQVETAVMRANGIPADDRIALRGRLQRIQGYGIIPKERGRGYKLSLSFDDACVASFCVVLSQLGIGPASIHRLVSVIKSAFLRAIGESAPQLIAFSLRADGDATSKLLVRVGTRSPDFMARASQQMGAGIIVIDSAKIRDDLLVALTAGEPLSTESKAILLETDAVYVS